MGESEYAKLRAEYIRASKMADQARQVWSAFLVTAPLDATVPPMTGNVVQAHRDLVAAEQFEATARDALFALINPSR